MTLEDVKLYLRIDGDVEDTLLTQLLTASDSYMADAVTNYRTYYGKDDDYTAKADVARHAIISDMYENRNADALQQYGYTVQSIIRQLDLWG